MRSPWYKRKSSAILAGAVIVVGASVANLINNGRSVQESKTNQISDLRIALVGDTPKLSIYKIDSILTYDIMAPLHLGLTIVDSNSAVYSGVAKSWRVNENRTKYVFKLRTDMTFATGQSLQCSMAIESLQRQKERNHPSPLFSAFQSATCLDQSTLQVDLNYPLNIFLQELASLDFSVVAESRSDQQFDGLGGYSLVELYPGKDPSIVLQKKIEVSDREALTASPQKLSFYQFDSESKAVEALENGLVDLVPVYPGSSSVSNRHRLIAADSFSRLWVLRIADRTRNKDQGIRRCIEQALDRDAAARETGGRDFAVPAYGVVPPPDPAYFIANRQVTSSAGSSRSCFKPDARLLTSDTEEDFVVSLFARQLGFAQNQVQKVRSRELVSRLITSDFDVAIFSFGVDRLAEINFVNFYSRYPFFLSEPDRKEVSETIRSLLTLPFGDVRTSRLIDQQDQLFEAGYFFPLIFVKKGFLTSRCLGVVDSGQFRTGHEFERFRLQDECQQ